MSALLRLARLEARSLIGSAGLVLTWLILLCVGIVAIAYGVQEVKSQENDIAALPQIIQQQETILKRHAPDGAEAGSMAYHLFLPTSHPPSDGAALALGNRDQLPYTGQVRMLGLYGQLFDNELANPVQATSGIFDLAFVLVIILPVWLIVLLHGLLAEDRERGTHFLLAAQPGSRARVFTVRAATRYLATTALAWLLITLGLFWSGHEWGTVTVWWYVLSAAYLLFWALLTGLIVAFQRSSAWTLTVSLGVWAMASLILPAFASAWLEQARPVADGAELMLDHRQTVNTGWDLPKEATFERFFETHPQWSDTPPVEERFHWKWYYAMQQVGDDSVAEDIEAYFATLTERQRWTDRLGLVLPPVGHYTALTGLATTDLEDHLKYLKSVQTFHDELRAFFYPLIFNEETFHSSDIDKAPRHEPPEATPRSPWHLLIALSGWSVLFGVGIRMLLGPTRARRTV